MSRSVLLRLPGLRRYAAEIDRLRHQLASAKEDLVRQKSSETRFRREAHDLARALADQDRELRALRLDHRTRGTADKDAEELMRKALHFDYYWQNADKKIDLHEIEGFSAIAARVLQQNRTLLALDRLYTLWQGVAALRPAASAVAEVGAYRGGSARFVAEAMREAGRELPFYVCDTFRGHVEVDASIDGRHAVAAQFAATDAERVTRYLRSFSNIQILAGDFRETSARLKDERRFGLVHIDVDVYPITRFCLGFFANRMVPGGTIVVDDYGFTTCQGARKAVDEFAAANPAFRTLHLLTGQAVVIPLGA